MVYKPTFTREELKEKFSHLQKLNYNQFRWWRLYDVKKKPLAAHFPFRDRIANGDYDFSHYWYQAAWVEHDINDLAIECKDDAGLFSEKVQVLSARRKRLYEDYEKDEKWKLDDLVKEFSRNFHITKDEAMLEMEEFGGTLLELYDYISTHSKYKLKANKAPRVTFKKRGRPKKISV
tara:strand:+ start:570 stop:1100 length:531 start_codon:yes stop_codon:yes gene_type:complete